MLNPNQNMSTSSSSSISSMSRVPLVTPTTSSLNDVLPNEIFHQIAQFIARTPAGNYDYYSLRRACKQTRKCLPEIRSQEEFNMVLKKRYRKDALRIYLSCHRFLKPSQAFAELACEYSHLPVLELITKYSPPANLATAAPIVGAAAPQTAATPPPIDFQKLFLHCVELNLETGLKVLLRDSRVNPAFNQSYAFQLATLREHFEVTQLLLKDGRVDREKAYVVSKEMEKLLERYDKSVAGGAGSSSNAGTSGSASTSSGPSTTKKATPASTASKSRMKSSLKSLARGEEDYVDKPTKKQKKRKEIPASYIKNIARNIKF